MNYVDTREELEVPKNAGVTGFLRAIERILKLPRVQEIKIDNKGKVTYRYFAAEGQTEPPAVDFETLLPYAVARNAALEEVHNTSAHAGVALAQLFTRVAADKLFPIAFASGAESHFWRWYASSMGFDASTREELFGLPFLLDRKFEPYTLFLFAGFERVAPLVDTHKSYKLVIPR